MEWYLIVLIAVGALVGLFLLILLLGKVFKPKFKHHKKQVVSPLQKPSGTQAVSSSVGQMVGLNLDNKLKLEEDVIFDEPNKKTPPTPPRTPPSAPSSARVWISPPTRA